MKILKVHLTDEQHKKLRMMAAEKCVAMSELVRWWLDEKQPETEPRERVEA